MKRGGRGTAPPSVFSARPSPCPEKRRTDIYKEVPMKNVNTPSASGAARSTRQPQSDQLLLRRHSGYYLRLRLDQGQSDQGKARRPENDMWRYRELLPIEDTTEPTPLRVGWSPLYEEPRLAEQLGLKRLWVKDDGQNPTASLKDRASAMAVAKAREAGARSSPAPPPATPPRPWRATPPPRDSRPIFCALPGAQGQGGPADDLRRHRHLRAGQL
jgi:hypothetical protein